MKIVTILKILNKLYLRKMRKKYYFRNNLFFNTWERYGVARRFIKI
jgi:hypothetical protein